MSAEERLIRYCKIETQSNPDNYGVTPSSENQFDLARVLKDELIAMGIEKVELDEHCYVYAWLPANTDQETKTVGFIAHMDTAPDFTGKGVNPRIIECFDGNDIVLNEDVIMKMEDFPHMKALKGKRLMVTDGNTLLGADDKAGIASIMEAVQYLVDHPEVKHGKVCVAFTPDEEIGAGTACFDIEKFGADFAFTMDGGPVNEYSDETFNAASAKVEFKGFSIHPGSAKDKMINAASLACKFHDMLPEHMTPEHTEKREGFIHLGHMEGGIESATLGYILRDHDKAKLEEKKVLLENTGAYFNQVYGEGTCTVTTKDSYDNMGVVLEKHPEIKEVAYKTLRDLGLEPLNEAVRGGTDGSALSLRGLPCPNLGCGGGNFHGRYEYCALDELELSVQVILNIIQNLAA